MTSEKPEALLIALITTFGLFYIGLALGNGLDRLSATRPELAHEVPELFASEALRVAGAQALGDGNARAMRIISERAIRDAPSDPQSAAMLGAALLASGDQTRADRAFRVAGRLGWRVPITQNYWMSKALAVSDYQSAALRLDALARQLPSLINEPQLLNPMERNPAGRAALIQRMARHPAWLTNYVAFDAAAPADALVQRSVVLEEAADVGVLLGCEAVAPMVKQLVGQKLVDDGARLWRAQCSVIGRAMVANPPI